MDRGAVQSLIMASGLYFSGDTKIKPVYDLVDGLSYNNETLYVTLAAL